MQQLLELSKNKMVEEEFKLLSKFIIKTEIRQIKMESISDSQITNKNMMLFQHKLHHIAQLQSSFVINLPNL